MSTSKIQQLTLDIDRVVRPQGGEPLLKAQDLNVLLHSVVDALATAPGLDPYSLSAALRTEVVQGTYNASGELTTALSAPAAAESQAGQCFSYGPALYAYLPGDAGTLAWVRTWKGGAAGGPTPGLEVLAVGPVGGYVGGGNFNTVPLGQARVDVAPAGVSGGWDQASSCYRAPISGLYELGARVRITDADGPVGANYAVGAGPANTDGEWMQWNTIFSVNTPYNRKGNQTTRVLHLAAGEAVRLYVYLDGFGATLGGELTVKLLRRD